MISTLDQRKAPYLSFSPRKNMTEAFLRLTKVVKGVTDDKTNFKRRILVSFIKSTSKESIFPEMQRSKDLFFGGRKGGEGCA